MFHWTVIHSGVSKCYMAGTNIYGSHIFRLDPQVWQEESPFLLRKPRFRHITTFIGEHTILESWSWAFIKLKFEGTFISILSYSFLMPNGAHLLSLYSTPLPPFPSDHSWCQHLPNHSSFTTQKHFILPFFFLPISNWLAKAVNSAYTTSFAATPYFCLCVQSSSFFLILIEAQKEPGPVLGAWHFYHLEGHLGRG